MLRLIAVLAALAFGAAAVPALAQPTAEEKKESASEKARGLLTSPVISSFHFSRSTEGVP